MQNANAAFFALNVDLNATDRLVLPYRHSAYIKGRLLVVPFPVLPVIKATDRYAGAFQHESVLTQAVMQTPTTDELKQLHALGLYFVEMAMQGKGDYLMKIYAEFPKAGQGKAKKRHIAIPNIGMIKKLRPSSWVPATYVVRVPHAEDDRVSGFVDMSSRNSLQHAVDAICDAFNYERINVAERADESAATPVQPARKRNAAYRLLASSKISKGWTEYGLIHGLHNRSSPGQPTGRMARREAHA